MQLNKPVPADRTGCQHLATCTRTLGRVHPIASQQYSRPSICFRHALRSWRRQALSVRAAAALQDIKRDEYRCWSNPEGSQNTSIAAILSRCNAGAWAGFEKGNMHCGPLMAVPAATQVQWTLQMYLLTCQKLLTKQPWAAWHVLPLKASAGSTPGTPYENPPLLQI